MKNKVALPMVNLAYRYEQKNSLPKEKEGMPMRRPTPVKRPPRLDAHCEVTHVEIDNAPEIEAILSRGGDLRQRTLFMLVIKSGILLKEIYNLHIEDIDFHRMSIIIFNEKSELTHSTIFDQALAQQLNLYIQTYTPKSWLFEKAPDEPYSTRALQMMLKKFASLSNCQLSFVELRKYFAQNLHRQGVSISQIQRYLGHKKLSTTIALLRRHRG